MIRIFFSYRHVDAPWGGANNFIRELHNELSDDLHLKITDSVEDHCDVVFMNQLGKGPGGEGKRYSLAQVRSWKAHGHTIVVRAVNLNRHAFRLGLKNFTLGWMQDRETIALLNLADAVIFQSDYQRQFFIKAGYCGTQSAIIHNGGARSFWIDKPITPFLGDQLRLVSSTASTRESKRHDLIAKLSRCEGVEVWHLGAWPSHLSCEKVRLMGTISSDQMVQFFSDAHYFLHPAIHDPCPNAVFEAVCAGLPVVYNPGPGSSREILGSCGLPLNEQNLISTVRTARMQYAALRSKVLQVRYRFSIENAVSAYRGIFLNLVGGLGVK